MKPLRLLVVEDNPDDEALVLLELRRNGFRPEAHRVQTEEAMREALAATEFDIILSDYSMPRFTALEALEVRLERSMRQVRRLGTLVEALLDVSRLSSGELSLSPERLELAEVARGVVERYLERIFERFGRAVSSRSYGGLGLGLYLARRAAEAHGGRAWAEPREGGGAIFTLELPLEKEERE